MRKGIALYRKYFALVDVWKTIVDRDEPVADRQEACFFSLTALVQDMASIRIGQINAPLRFYADMLLLRYLLSPIDAKDEFGYIAIHPSYKLVCDWLMDNINKQHINMLCIDLKISQYMEWQQLRAICMGDELGFAALDRNADYSEYVHSVLGRIIKDSS